MLTQKMLGGFLGQISGPNGCPTTRGFPSYNCIYLIGSWFYGFEPVYKIIGFLL